MDLNHIIESYRDEIIRSTQELVAIPSVEGEPQPGKPFGEDVYRALDYVLTLGRRLGFETKNVDGYAGHIEFGQGEKMLGILTHLDVVPEGSGWTYPPYGGEIHDGRIYGRGAIDDKGPTIAVLYAMKAVMQSGIPVNKKVRLILGTDEESGWEDLKYYFKREAVPDFGMSPDGRYPIINAEKGILHIALCKKFSSGQKSSIGIEKIYGGQRPNVVPDECICVFGPGVDREKLIKGIEDFKGKSEHAIEVELDQGGTVIVKSIGQLAHASMPEKGKNAIGQMLLCLSALGLGYSEMERFIAFLSEAIGMQVDGQSMGLALEDQLSGKLTLNLGMIQVDSQVGRAVIDIRYPVSFEEQEILARIHMVADMHGVEVEVLDHQGPLYVPEDHFLVQTLKKVYAEQTGQPAYTVAIGGGTYARAIKNAVAFGAVFPGKPEMAHQRNEYIEIEDLMMNAKIYAHAIAELVK
ncbi:MAG: dipeptidase PepV [Caldicoprobacter oshimai]|nr:MAG: dipeptidase PepV [Caldicoprobacter oshimai]